MTNPTGEDDLADTNYADGKKPTALPPIPIRDLGDWFDESGIWRSVWFAAMKRVPADKLLVAIRIHPVGIPRVRDVRDGFYLRDDFEAVLLVKGQP